MTIRGTLRYMDIYSMMVIFSIVILFVSYVPEIPLAGLFDDIVAVIFGLVYMCSLLKKRVLPRVIKKILFLLVAITLIGLLSNAIKPLDRTIEDVAIDMFSFWKIFLVYAGMVAITHKKKKRTYRILKITSNICKVFILAAFVGGILNVFDVVNMSSGERYGMKMYAFYFGNPSQFGVFVGVAMSIIFMAERKTLFYELIGLTVLFMTVKGMALIIAAVYITFRIASRRRNIQKWQLVLASLVLVFTLQFQIQSYLLSEAAPRAILLNYGFKTANDYLPLGSGFGTYGSNTAAEHYSPLYIQYGFMYREALVEDLENGNMSALNDVYLGMVVGQFGYIGLLIFIYITYLIGKNIFKSKIVGKKEKYMTIACFACMCGMFVMAGSVKAAPGEILMMVMALYSFSPSLCEANLTKAVNEIKASDEGNEIECRLV